MRVNEKTTKNAMVKFLKEVSIKDTKLMARVTNTLDNFAKNMNSITKKHLTDLIDDINAFSNKEPLPIENSLKPKNNKLKTKEETKQEPKEETKQETKEVTKEVEKKTLKSSNKPKEVKKEVVESLPPVSNVGVDIGGAKMFPQTIAHKELGNLVACTNEYTNYSDILVALENDLTLYIACYWSPQQIKKFNYGLQHRVKAPKKFEYDLDFAMAVLPCETIERLYAMSRITEALYSFEGSDFEYVEDTDPRSGDKFKVRVSAGMEFELYRVAEEEVVKSK